MFVMAAYCAYRVSSVREIQYQYSMLVHRLEIKLGSDLRERVVPYEVTQLCRSVLMQELGSPENKDKLDELARAVTKNILEGYQSSELVGRAIEAIHCEVLNDIKEKKAIEIISKLDINAISNAITLAAGGKILGLLDDKKSDRYS